MALKSNFDQVLDTNYIPSASEIEHLRSLIQEPEERIQKLEERIALLQAERDELKRFADRHRALLSPFRRLPPDIWGEIFVQCLPESNLNLCTCVSTKPPLLFTAICQTWRRIALKTPRLWTSIHIFLPGLYPGQTGNDHCRMMESKREGIKSWLNRSGSLPLTISVSMSFSRSLSLGSTNDDAGSGSHTKFMDFLVGYSRRWKTLALGSGVCLWNQESFRNLTVDDVPLLENVYTSMNLFTSSISAIADFSTIAPPSPPLPTVLAKLLPKISSLRSLRSVHESISILYLPFDWSRLTEFHLSCLAGSSMLPGTILRKLAKACHSMTTLSLQSEVMSRRIDIGSLGEIVDWPSLRELNLSLEGGIYNLNSGTRTTEGHPFHPVIKDIFESINAPGLLRLSIQFRPSNRRPAPAGETIVLPFHDFVSQATRLTHIQIHGCRILDVAALSQCLQRAPSLKVLVLRQEPMKQPRGNRVAATQTHHVQVGGWITGLLTSLNIAREHLSELEVLDCGQCGIEDVKSIMEFAGRWGGGASKLRQLKADVRELLASGVEFMISEGMNQALRDLRDAKGVSVAINWAKAPPRVQDGDRAKYDSPSTGLPVFSLGW
ncbi:hypothetical protein PM082_000375 [Marasmius tenuissimus]|nr:hypothetical protein PM082_000375 [Marasmius tenuissimus]